MPPGRRLLLVSALVALIAVTMAGGELGRTGPSDDRGAEPITRRTDVAPTFDANDVADQVHHAVRPVADRPEQLAVGDDAYQARFDGSGFGVRPPGAEADLRISLRGASRGGRNLVRASGPWAPQANRAERVVGAGMTEVVTAREGELEWDVVLDAAPAGRGDLVVTAELDGTTAVGRDGNGLDISLDGGGQLDMGALVVKDAAGAVVHRAVPQIAGRHLRLVVPDGVVSRARYPLTLDPTIGPERTVHDDGGHHGGAAVAFDGTNYLVVWERTFSSSLVTNLYAARVEPDGTVLDPEGITISEANNFQGEADVVFTGTNFLVAWLDNRSNATNDVYATRVSRAGTVLDTFGFPLSAGTGNQYGVDLAFDGTNVLATWSDTRNGASDIYGTRWSPSAGVLDPAGIPISTASGAQQFPTVTYVGADYLVVWQDRRSGTSDDIYASVVHANGVVRDTAGALFSNAAGDQQTPAAAFDGSNVLVVWSDRRTGTSFDLWAVRWSPTSGLLGSDFPVSVAGDNQIRPAVTHNGSFLVLWQDRRNGVDDDLFAARVTNGGSVSDTRGLLVSGNAEFEYDVAAIRGESGSWLAFYCRTLDGLHMRSVAPK